MTLVEKPKVGMMHVSQSRFRIRAQDCQHIAFPTGTISPHRGHAVHHRIDLVSYSANKKGMTHLVLALLARRLQDGVL